MPIFAWAMLVFALMVVFAFPAVILATALLELERAFHWPFFTAAKGGDPLLWQHLFWFFGHPEVYIIFLPAAGMVSMIVPTMVRAPLVSLSAGGARARRHRVPELRAVGAPHVRDRHSRRVAVVLRGGEHGGGDSERHPGVRVDRDARERAREARLRPTLFVLGFLFTFVLGGLTGVMVAAVPFDLQAHDTYFVVAHLHYVLIGGMVFPLFAALYYWTPLREPPRALRAHRPLGVRPDVRRRQRRVLSDAHHRARRHAAARLHVRRGYGWGALNFVSTIGAFMIAAAVALFLFDFARRFRFAPEDNAGNVWDAGTLEWLPTGNYSSRSIPRVTSRYPLWDQPGLADEVEAGASLPAERADRPPRDAAHASAGRRVRRRCCACPRRDGRRSWPPCSPLRSSCCSR